MATRNMLQKKKYKPAQAHGSLFNMTHLQSLEKKFGSSPGVLGPWQKLLEQLAIYAEIIFAACLCETPA